MVCLTYESSQKDNNPVPRTISQLRCLPAADLCRCALNKDKKMSLKPDWSEIEVYWIEFEYLKHLTTISTGSILLIVAFLEKIFQNPEAKYLVAIALCCFVLSISLCAFSQLTIIEKASERSNLILVKKVQNWTVGLLFAALISYVIGVISLVIFGLKNLF